MKNSISTWRKRPLLHLLLAVLLSLISFTTLVNTAPVFAAPAQQSESGDTEQDPLEEGEAEDDDDGDEDDDEDDGDDDDEDENEVYGTVESMPNGSLIGNWTVDGVQYVAVESTEFEEEDGALAVGAMVELEFTLVDGVNQLDEIETDSDSDSDLDETDEDDVATDGMDIEANSNTAASSNEFATLARAFGFDLQKILFLPTAFQ